MHRDRGKGIEGPLQTFPLSFSDEPSFAAGAKVQVMNPPTMW